MYRAALLHGQAFCGNMYFEMHNLFLMKGGESDALFQIPECEEKPTYGA